LVSQQIAGKLMAQMPAGKVKPIQEMLNKLVRPKPELKVDGVLGKNTVAALKEFQKRAGVKETGEVDSETAPAIARAIKTGKIEKDQPTVYVDLGGGKYAGFTDREWKSEQKKMADKLLSGPVREAKMKAAEAKATWEHFDELNNDQYIVSFFVEATRGASLPAKGLIEKADKAAMDLESLAKAQDFGGFMRRARTASGEINSALDAMRKYRSEMIDGAGNWVTGLEWTKAGAFTILSIYAAPVAASALGTGALASAVIGGAAVKGLESAAGEIGNLSAGNAKGQDPGGMISRVLIDTAVGAVTGWLSKGGGAGKSVAERITRGITENIGKKLIAKGVSEKAVETVVKWVLSEGGKKVLEGAVGDAAKALKGDPKMTVDQFIANVIKNFGTGVALGPLNKWIEGQKDLKNLTFDNDTKKKLQASVEKEILKKLDDKIMVDTFRKEADKMIEKYAADVVKKTVGKTVGELVSKAIVQVVDVEDIRKLHKAFNELLFTPQTVNQCAAPLADEIVKDLKKRKK
jgi:ribosomal protein S7